MGDGALPPRDPANMAQVRIFTPGRELPFAAHPDVGTAFALAQLGLVSGQARFEEAAALVPVDLLLGRRNQAFPGSASRRPLSLAASES